MEPKLLNDSPAPLDMRPVSGKKEGFFLRIKGYILDREISTKLLAHSFALGLSVAFNPLLGLHTLVLLVISLFLRRLHKPLLFSAAFVNNPWTVVPIATASVFLGNLLLGRGWGLDLQGVDWKSLGLTSFTSREGFHLMLRMLEPILWPYLLGGALLSLAAYGGGYALMLVLARKWRQSR